LKFDLFDSVKDSIFSATAFALWLLQSQPLDWSPLLDVCDCVMAAQV
jgi:hypothetical protein